jgi:hypothetical protein
MRGTPAAGTLYTGPKIPVRIGRSGYNAGVTLDDFRISLHEALPPADIVPLLAAMWWDGKGDWHRAHNIAQEVSSADGAWVHAYLHRKEGDEGNAGYWYGQARKPHSRLPLESEWDEIVNTLLRASQSNPK